MSKEFVPYEIALALKELGFDEPCFAFYRFGKEFYIKGKHKNTTLAPTIGPTVPLYQQAFRWFREKYGWIAEVHGSLQMNHFYANLLSQASGEVNNIKICESYEEAELACLRKLIEIAKGKCDTSK